MGEHGEGRTTMTAMKALALAIPLALFSLLLAAPIDPWPGF
jgi:hypothetical protein